MLWKSVGYDIRGGWWTFRNWNEIGLSTASRDTTQTNKKPKHYVKNLGSEHISSTLRKKRKQTKWSLPPLWSKSYKTRLTSLNLKANVIWLPRLLAVKMIRQQVSITNRLDLTSVHHPTNKRRKKLRTPAEHSRLIKVDHHLWEDWAFIRTSLSLTLNWRFASE